MLAGRNCAERTTQKPVQGKRWREQPREEGAGQSKKRNVIVVVDAGPRQRQRQEVVRRQAVDAEGIADWRCRTCRATAEARGPGSVTLWYSRVSRWEHVVLGRDGVCLYFISKDDKCKLQNT